MDKAEKRLHCLVSHYYSHQDKKKCNDKLSGQTQHRLRSHGIGRIFDRLKNLTGHFLHTMVQYILCSICSDHTNFERLDVYIFVRLTCFRVNRTPERTNFQPVESSSGAIMAKVEWKKRSISTTAAAVYDGHDNDNLKKKTTKTTKDNKLDTDEFSTGRKFVCLGVPFTRNHANCTKISTLKSKTENFEAVRSKIWLVQCAHHTIRKYNSIQAQVSEHVYLVVLWKVTSTSQMW